MSTVFSHRVHTGDKRRKLKAAKFIKGEPSTVDCHSSVWHLIVLWYLTVYTLAVTCWVRCVGSFQESTPFL